MYKECTFTPKLNINSVALDNTLNKRESPNRANLVAELFHNNDLLDYEY